MKSFFTVIIFSVLLFSINAPNGYSQGVTTAAINGIVQDKNGEPLPGANVVAIHQPTGTRYGASTRADGNFNISNMRAGGPYIIRSSFIGYQEETVENIHLALGQNLNIRINLIEETVQLGDVEVIGSRDRVFDSDRTGASTNVGLEQIEALPTLNRSIFDFTRLTPQSDGNNFAGRDNRFNNLTIDGAVNNDVFGLSPTPGGQTNTQPISLDAIQEVQVNIAPYDVRQGSFTGAGINAITRSGTNEFSGSVYTFYRNEKLAGDQVRDVEVPNDEFSNSQTGFRLGGPIIKNKVFFFVNGERENRIEPPVAFRARRGNEPIEGVVSRVSQEDAERFRNHLMQNYNFDPGLYEGYTFDQQNTKLFGRLDFNLSEKHRLTLRHNYVTAFRDIPVSQSGSQGGRQNDRTSLPFNSANYRQNNTTNSTVLELNSALGTRFSNNLILTRVSVRDFRESQTGTRPFPLIDIESEGTTYMSAGYEPFSPNNQLDQDIYQITNNFNIYAGRHVFTLGTHNEIYRFRNGFMPRFYGNYIYSSLDDFIQNNAPREYQITFSRLPGQAIPFATFNAAQVGVYVQDEWQVLNNLNITAGLRIDVPWAFNSNAPRNAAVEETFGLRTDQFPAAQLMFSPRIGFNWDVFGNASSQLRGGTGIFTGRPPFVWLSNQVGNNGVSTGFLQLRDQQAEAIRFRDDIPQLILNEAGAPVNPDGSPIPGVSNTSNIAITGPEFRFPQVFRASLGLDQRLPGDFILTLEGLYSNDINAIIYQDLNLVNPTERMAGDGRLVYPSGSANNIPNRLVDGRFTDVMALNNTSRAYQLNLTAQVQKSFRNGFYVMGAYNFGRAEDLTSATSSIARSSFTANAVLGDANQLTLATSNNELRHRIIGNVIFGREYLNHFGTTVSLFYNARSGVPFSYTYAGDLNNDGINGNDLIYVPASREEIILLPSNANDTRTAEEIWQQLDSYISQDKYLSSRRGQHVERNGSRTPWSFQMDLSIRQDFFVNVAGKRNTIQLSFDVFNVGNLLNPDWGVMQLVNRNQLISFRGTEDGTATGRPRFSFNNLDSSFRDNLALASKWQGQLGVRYIFN